MKKSILILLSFFLANWLPADNLIPGDSSFETGYGIWNKTGKIVKTKTVNGSCAVRIETAKKLLADSAIPIGAVAERCGYSDDSLLRRAFKSATGLSLSEYRKSLAR